MSNLKSLWSRTPTPPNSESVTEHSTLEAPPTEEADKNWDEERTQVLRKRRHGLKLHRKARIGIGAILLSVGCSAGTIVPFYADSSRSEGRAVIATVVIYGFIAVAFAIYSLSGVGELSVEIQSVEDDMDLIEFKKQPAEVRAYKLFRLNQLEVKRHYTQTLSQGAVIFAVGIFCILSGFAIIGITLKLLSSANGSTTTKFIIGGVGVIGGILTNFVAYIYLKMHKATSDRLVEQQHRLITTHFLHFGNYLAARISEDQELRNETLSEMAKVLAESSGNDKRASEKST